MFSYDGIKNENVKKTVRFTENVKRMMCTIDEDKFFCSHGSKIPVQFITSWMMITVYLMLLTSTSQFKGYRNMPATRKDKLCLNVWQVDGTEQVHILWPMKFCPKAGVNLFSLTCELLQGTKISSDQWNNIMVKFTDGNIILDCWIKTHVG